MGKPTKIILIDDNHTTNFLNEMVIKKSGHDVPVVAFDKPAEAINFFNTQTTHQDQNYLIFLDINMPEIDGWGFADAYADLRISQNHVIIMLTSSVDPRDKDRALSHSVIRDYHPKPLTFEVINNVFRKYF